MSSKTSTICGLFPSQSKASCGWPAIEKAASIRLDDAAAGD
jgi:hypothetical protein